MPTYEYECTVCNHSFEKFQSITASSARKCPECGKLKLRRLIGSGAGIIFRGSGFYQTDYRSADYKKQAGAATEAASSSKASKTSESSTSTADSSSKPASDTKSTSGGKAAG